MGSLAVLSRRGDDPIVWDPKDPESVAKAKKEFDDLRAKGYSAFYEKKRMDEFDPAAGKVVMAPPMSGG